MRGHLPALDHGGMDPAPAPYMIRINGHLGATVLSAFPAMAPQHHGAHTVLTGLLDRSALYGVLAEIEALGLDLLEIRKLTPDRKSPGPGDSRLPRWQVASRAPDRCHEKVPLPGPVPRRPTRSLRGPRAPAQGPRAPGVRTIKTFDAPGPVARITMIR